MALRTFNTPRARAGALAWLCGLVLLVTCGVKLLAPEAALAVTNHRWCTCEVDNDAVDASCHQPGGDVVLCEGFENDQILCLDDADEGGRNAVYNDGHACHVFVTVPEIDVQSPSRNFVRCASRGEQGGPAGSDCAMTSGEPNSNYNAPPQPSVGIQSKRWLYNDAKTGDGGHDEIYVAFYMKETTGYVRGHEKQFTIFHTDNSWQYVICNKGQGSAGLANCEGGTLGEFTGNFTAFGLDFDDHPNEWIFQEFRFKENTSTSCTHLVDCDGILEIWVDACGVDGLGCDPATSSPTKRHSTTTIKYTDDLSRSMGIFWMEHWANPASDGIMYRDQFVVSRSFIEFAPLQGTSVDPGTMAIVLGQIAGVAILAKDMIALAIRYGKPVWQPVGAAIHSTRGVVIVGSYFIVAYLIALVQVLRERRISKKGVTDETQPLALPDPLDSLDAVVLERDRAGRDL